MKNSSTAKAFAAVAIATGLFAATPARADIITALASTAVVSGGYAYTYNVQLSGGQLDPFNGTDSNGQAVNPQFGTVYDFGPLLTSSGNVIVSTTGYLSSFNFTFALTNTPAPLTSPSDDPTLSNVRFTYASTNGIAVAGQAMDYPSGTNVVQISTGNSNLGTFTVESPYAPDPVSELQYDGTTYKGTNDTQQANVGVLSGPLVPSVPEPASMALLGSALAGLGIIRRRK